MNHIESLESRRLFSFDVDANFAFISTGFDSTTMQSAEEVKEAIAIAIDRDVISAATSGTDGESLTGGPYSSSSSWANTSLVGTNEFDPIAAAYLLEASGWVEPTPGAIRVNSNYEPLELEMVVPLTSSDDERYETTAEIIAYDLRQVGIELNLTYVALENFSETFDSGSYDLALNWWLGSAGPGDWARDLLSEGGAYNYFHFSDPTVDELLGDIDASTDLTEIIALQSELQAVALDSGNTIFLTADTSLIVAKFELDGDLQTTGSGTFELSDGQATVKSMLNPKLWYTNSKNERKDYGGNGGFAVIVETANGTLDDVHFAQFIKRTVLDVNNQAIQMSYSVRQGNRFTGEWYLDVELNQAGQIYWDVAQEAKVRTETKLFLYDKPGHDFAFRKNADAVKSEAEIQDFIVVGGEVKWKMELKSVKLKDQAAVSLSVLGGAAASDFGQFSAFTEFLVSYDKDTWNPIRYDNPLN